VDETTSLHGFADIVSYSSLNARRQEEPQERLVRAINVSLADAGVRPDSVGFQVQGDACMLTFPDGLDVSKVLAVMPRRFNDELIAFNRDKVPDARMRVRLSFAIGPSAPGATGRRGSAPIAVVRLNSAPALRAGMAAQPDAYLGLVIDDYLYHQYVVQEFRTDLAIAEYTPTHVSLPDKKFEAQAWIRLVGYPAAAWASDEGSDLPTVSRPARKSFSLPADSLSRRQSGARDDETRGKPAPDSDGAASEEQKKPDKSNRLSTPVKVALIGAIGVIVAAAITAATSLASPGGTVGTNQGPASAPAATSASESAAVTEPTNGTITGKLYPEVTDNHLGTDVFADPMGGAVTSGSPSIQYGTHVLVKCWAPNESGMISINDFYLIETKPWAGEYAPANTFLNADTTGTRDPDVPECPAA
jgi:hypothetical protein